MPIYSVPRLADAFSHSRNAEASRVEQERNAFNFKITSFNALSAALIATVALAVLAKSTLLLAVAFIVLKARKAFARNIDATDHRPLEQKVRLQVLDLVVFRKGREAVAEEAPRHAAPPPAVAARPPVPPAQADAVPVAVAAPAGGVAPASPEEAVPAAMAAVMGGLLQAAVQAGMGGQRPAAPAAAAARADEDVRTVMQERAAALAAARAAAAPAAAPAVGRGSPQSGPQVDENGWQVLPEELQQARTDRR